ncbi:MAG: hypothetical protein JXQ66_07020, partial [Campylobacterales bacterium]|nr:hypothetical protein [Campylobacterales bacterium]
NLAKYALIIKEHKEFGKLGNALLHFCKVLNKFNISDEYNLNYALNCLESFTYTLKCWHRDILSNKNENPNKYVNSILSDIEEIRLINTFG